MSSNLKLVPQLDELVNNPLRIKDLPVEAVADLYSKTTTLGIMLLTHLLQPCNNQSTTDEDRLLSVKDAVSPPQQMRPATLYHRYKDDAAIRACVVNNGTSKLLFSSQKIELLIQRRTGR